MSHHSGDENMFVATSDSFWEPGNYRRTTRRIDDSYKLCSDLVSLISERAELEKNYAKNLKNWSKKWNDVIEKGPEYGTTEAAWKGILVEADRLSDIHVKIKDKLCSEIVEQVKTWQKETYQKNSNLLQGVIQCKVRKEMEDSFKKAQKPWAKLLSKVNKTKTSYHCACKSEKSALNQERNAGNDSSWSQDQLKKLQDRVTKAKDEVHKTHDKYTTALQDINNYNAKYMDDMTVVFDKCQEMESLRLLFFKDILFSIHKVLNISQYPELPQIYEEFHHTINNADYEKDLKWWSNNHGVNMAMNWPQFEGYVEEFRDITKGKSKESLPVPNIMLINQRPVGEDFQDLPPSTISSSYTNSNNSNKNTAPRGNHVADGSVNMAKLLRNSNEASTNDKSAIATTSHRNSMTNKNTSSSAEVTSTATATTNSMGKRSVLEHKQTVQASSSLNKSLSNGTSGESRNETNPFEEEEWDENDALVDNGEPGVPVKALYDYERAENDELSFKQGDVFEKLEDEDEQGWCKGRKDGRVGLYPANYVKEISQ